MTQTLTPGNCAHGFVFVVAVVERGDGRVPADVFHDGSQSEEDSRVARFQHLFDRGQHWNPLHFKESGWRRIVDVCFVSLKTFF